MGGGEGIEVTDSIEMEGKEDEVRKRSKIKRKEKREEVESSERVVKQD